MKLEWDRDHNVATIVIADGDLTSRARDVWQPSDDLVFDLDADGQVISIELLDPASLLQGVTTAEEALSRVLGSIASLRVS